MIESIQPYNLPLWLFRDKTLKQTLDLICELRIVAKILSHPYSRNCEAFEPYEQIFPENNNTRLTL